MQRVLYQMQRVLGCNVVLVASEEKMNGDDVDYYYINPPFGMRTLKPSKKNKNTPSDTKENYLDFLVSRRMLCCKYCRL